LVCASWLASLSVCLTALTEPTAREAVCPCVRDHESGSISGVGDGGDEAVVGVADVADVVEVECETETVVAAVLELEVEVVAGAAGGVVVSEPTEGCEPGFGFGFGWGRQEEE